MPVPPYPLSVLTGPNATDLDRVLTECAGQDNRIFQIRLQPDHDRFGRAAFFVLNRWKLWASTHLVTYGGTDDRLMTHLMGLATDDKHPIIPLDLPSISPTASTAPERDLFGQVIRSTPRPARQP
jgi:hypothetical protein